MWPKTQSKYKWVRIVRETVSYWFGKINENYKIWPIQNLAVSRQDFGEKFNILCHLFRWSKSITIFCNRYLVSGRKLNHCGLGWRLVKMNKISLILQHQTIHRELQKWWVWIILVDESHFKFLHTRHVLMLSLQLHGVYEW